ncbi:MAG: UDP-N-acetylmuramate dehydrogenase [Cyanobacteriota bacterium]
MTAKYYDNEIIDKYTTFRIGGKAKRLYIPYSKNDLLEIVRSLNYQEDNPIILGWGSNVLVSSKGYEGTVIVTKNLNKVEHIEKNVVYADAGITSPKLSKFCLEKCLSGLEFLIGIPGTLGGAIYMNSSANGQCIKDAIVEAEILDVNLKVIKVFNKDELGLSYRKSGINPKKQYIVSAKFALTELDSITIKEKMDNNLNFRKLKQPRGLNAGSIFKNPEDNSGVAAGYLLDKVGAKGMKEGGAIVSEIHANFIENFNNATSLDVSRLMLRMHKEVFEKTGYKLYPEIEFIGEQTEEEEKIWKILKAQ